jgi:putative peptidoglycan lipid II flippase
MTPGVKRLLWLAAPAAAAGGITQINLFIGQIIASTKEGAIAILQYADRIYQLPLGVVGIAIGVVLLPELARTLKAGHQREAAHTQNRALEFALFLTLPAAVGLMVMSTDIVRVLFERGAFLPETTGSTARALAVFGLGLPAFVMIKVFTPGYFAREDTRTPMLFAGISVVVNVALALTLFPLFAEAGIATAESTAGWVNAGLLYFVLHRRGYFGIDAGLASRAPRLIFASIAMGAALIGLKSLLLAPLLVRGMPFLVQFPTLLLLVSCGAIVYFGTAHLIGAADLRVLVTNFRRKQPAE